MRFRGVFIFSVVLKKGVFKFSFHTLYRLHWGPKIPEGSGSPLCKYARGEIIPLCFRLVHAHSEVDFRLFKKGTLGSSDAMLGQKVVRLNTYFRQFNGKRGFFLLSLSYDVCDILTFPPKRLSTACLDFLNTALSDRFHLQSFIKENRNSRLACKK